MISCLRTAASCTVTVFAGLFAASAGALLAALYAQFALGLEPCILCLYQRVPFLAVAVLSLAGLALRKKEKAVQFLIALCALAFLVNAGIAAYHTGVELKWWESQVEGCAVPDFSKDPGLLEKILTAPAAQCSDIAWKDPFLGLTMANYNVMYCLGLFMACAAALTFRRCRKPTEAP